MDTDAPTITAAGLATLAALGTGGKLFFGWVQSLVANCQAESVAARKDFMAANAEARADFMAALHPLQATLASFNDSLLSMRTIMQERGLPGPRSEVTR